MSKKQTKFKVEYRPLSELKLLDSNPRYIKQEDFERLCASGQNNPELFEAQPIILSDRTGELVVIAGNQRYKAAKEVGLTEVPTVLLSGLSEKKEREIIIRTNVTNGKWDWDILGNEWDIEELGDWGVDCSFLGSDSGDVDSLFENLDDDKKKAKDIKIEVVIPEEMGDTKDEIKTAIEGLLADYEGVKVK